MLRWTWRAGGEMAQSVEVLSHRHEDLSSEPEHPHKNQEW